MGKWINQEYSVFVKNIKKGRCLFAYFYKNLYIANDSVTTPQLLTLNNLSYDCMDYNNRSYGIGFHFKSRSKVASQKVLEQLSPQHQHPQETVQVREQVPSPWRTRRLNTAGRDALRLNCSLFPQMSARFTHKSALWLHVQLNYINIFPVGKLIM